MLLWKRDWPDSNLDTVTTVKNLAFANCKIGDMAWPGSCEEIPISCFRGSEIITLRNLSSVSVIRSGAFINMSNPNVIDFSESFAVDIAADTFADSKCKVNFSYYSNGYVIQ